MCATILLLGIGIRCRQYFGCPSYWYDEAYLLLNIFERPFSELIGPLKFQVVIPPGFLWVLRGTYRCLGPAEWAMRLPALLAGMAALLLMVPLARRVVGGSEWIWAVALAAVSGHAILHANEVRAYAGDLLCTESILLAGCLVLGAPASPRGQRWGMAGLAVLAMIAPWLSFPSAFVLAGASLAVLYKLWCGWSRPLWLGWLLINGVFFVSCLTLWYCDARHLYYPGLREHWDGWSGFPDTTSFRATLPWLAWCCKHMGDYATSSMGIPLVLLALLGLAFLGRRRGAIVVLLAGPVVIALLAACTRRYPLSDRTVMFAAPCLWLPAAVGLGVVMQTLASKARWAGIAVALVIVAPDSARALKHLFVVDSRVAYREAFAYVRSHRAAGDGLWVLHPEVYQVYFPAETPPLGPWNPNKDAEQAARAGRLWVIGLPRNARFSYSPELFEELNGPGFRIVDRQRLPGLEIVLYAAAEGTNPETASVPIANPATPAPRRGAATPLAPLSPR